MKGNLPTLLSLPNWWAKTPVAMRVYVLQLLLRTECMFLDIENKYFI